MKISIVGYNDDVLEYNENKTTKIRFKGLIMKI